jgi:hypothetical protein
MVKLNWATSTSGMRGSRWLFLIEGLLTLCVALMSILVLADYPETMLNRLNDEEKTLVVIRIMRDKQSLATQMERLAAWKGVKAAAAAAVNLCTYLLIILYITQNGPTTISYFFPTFLKGLGYTDIKAHWMTAPIWAVNLLSHKKPRNHANLEG